MNDVPGSPAARLKEALAAHNRGELDVAAAEYRKILAAQPNHFDALHLLGVLHMQRGEASEAERLMRAALQVRSDYVPALSNHALLLWQMSRPEEALQQFDRALALQPNAAETQYNRALLLLNLARPAEALAGFERTRALEPGHLKAEIGRADALERLGRCAEAIAAYDHALAIQPDDTEVLRNRSVAKHNLGRIEDARVDIQRALQIRPNFAEAHVLLAEGLLLRGDFGQGWQEYEWRWQTAGLRSRARIFAAPQWRGEDIAGRTILLHGEQGFGDMIQFCRFAKTVADRGARVLLEMPAELVPLMTSLRGPTLVLARGDAMPHFDFHCPLMSLPLALGAEAASARTAVPYLSADAADIAAWRARLPQDRRRVGLVWAGRATHINDHHRSIPLGAFAPLFARTDVALVAASSERRPQDAAAALGARNLLQPEIDGFPDSAALIGALDLVITVDTAFAHLAGALGKPVWVLLPFVPDWRWMLGRSDSPWYPTARLFRQPAPGDWVSVIAAVNAALTE